MIQNIIDNLRKKSLKERFLLVIGLLFFLSYLALGLMIIFWKKLPLDMPQTYRLAFGLLLIAYAGIRGYRIIKSVQEEA